MSNHKMSNSHNVELTKCRIHIMSNAQNVEFTKCRIFVKCWIFTNYDKVLWVNIMWFDIYKMSNFCPMSMKTHPQMFTILLRFSYVYVWNRSNIKENQKVGFSSMTLSLYKNNAYIQLLNAYSNISLICYIHIRSIISILKQIFRHLDVFPNTSKHYMHHCI